MGQNAIKLLGLVGRFSEQLVSESLMVSFEVVVLDEAHGANTNDKPSAAELFRTMFIDPVS